MERKLVKIALVLSATMLMWVYGFVQAANPTFKAESEEFWNGTAFVIVARALDVTPADEESPASYVVDLKPLACVSGLFNPAVHTRLTIDMALSIERRRVPEEGELLLVVIYDREKLGSHRPGYGLANGRCPFMPDNQPLIVLKGMDDPVILEVLKNMQAARPTTQPATKER